MPLPQFTPRTFEQILQEMINFVRTVAPRLTDFNIGSLIRTILEAAAWEDDEQYKQMIDLLRLWNLSNVKGTLLDERLVEYNQVRLGSLSAAGHIVLENTRLVTTFVSTGASKGNTVIQGVSSLPFPPSSQAPYTIRIGEGLSTVEDRTVSANDSVTGNFTIDALQHSHARGERISLVQGASLSGTAGQQARSPASGSLPSRSVTFAQDWEISAGNYESDPIAVVSSTPGIVGNITSGIDGVTEFVGSAPFDGAKIRNDAPISGGRDVESDAQFLSRARTYHRTLAKSTKLAIEQLILGIEYTMSSGKKFRVQSAKSRMFFSPNTLRDFVYLYMWPGGFDFVTSAKITNEQITTSAEDGQRFFRLGKIAIVPGSLILEKQAVGAAGYIPITLGTDYFLNEMNGDIQIADPGLSKGDKIRATSYTHYTGMIELVQKHINGYVTDPTVFPGIAAEGVKVLVTMPRPRKIDPIRIAIQAKPGYSETTLAPLVANAVERYYTELQIGSDIIRAEIIERGMAVEGMYNLQALAPTTDIVMLEDEMPDLENLQILVS